MAATKTVRTTMPTSEDAVASVRSHVRRAVAAALFAVAPAGVSFAADVYVVPEIDLQAEYNDNFGLSTDDTIDSDAYGFIADAQALIGVATPRGETTFRPRVRAQDFPDADDRQDIEKLKPLEVFFDVRSRYATERSAFSMLASYSLQDSYNADTVSGAFDPLDPDLGSDPTSSTVKVGETRTAFNFRPTYEYSVSERMRIGASAEYEIALYDSDGVESRTDYDFLRFDGFLAWDLTEVSELSAGGYVSKYEARDNSVETDAYGAEVGYRYRWSRDAGVEATLFYETNDVSNYIPVRFDESTSGVGGTISAYWEREVSQWRLSVGQRFLPSGDGGKAEVDEFRLQYERDFSPRLSFRGAGRFEARNAITSINTGDDRDFARADLSLEYMLTPTWYLRGGYAYIWQDREIDPDSADNNKVFISVGYRGLSQRSQSGAQKALAQ